MASSLTHSLPQGAEGPFLVSYVVDGDTFNLNDRRKIRVLGVDTPEMKTHAPFAAEAKAFGKKALEKQEVYLSYGSEKTDKYGRVLAMVFVKDRSNNVSGGGGAYFWYNKAIIEEGLAYAYLPSEVPGREELIGAQTRARLAKRNLWRTFVDYEVYRTARGTAFHTSDCSSVAGKRNIRKSLASEALDDGLSPCRTCLNPDGIDHKTNAHPEGGEVVGAAASPPSFAPQNTSTHTDKNNKNDSRTPEGHDFGDRINKNDGSRKEQEQPHQTQTHYEQQNNNDNSGEKSDETCCVVM